GRAPGPGGPPRRPARGPGGGGPPGAPPGAPELLAQMRLLDGRPDLAAHILGAVDLLRTSVFDTSYRPARYCTVARARSDDALRALLDDPELREAYEEGARKGLFALSRER
ncbi:hypothetical protein AB1388_38430, partial [Streptomyces hydrogenans]